MARRDDAEGIGNISVSLRFRNRDQTDSIDGKEFCLVTMCPDAFIHAHSGPNNADL